MKSAVQTLSSRNVQIVTGDGGEQIVFEVKKDQTGMLHMFCRDLSKLKYSSKVDAYSISLNAIGMGLTKLRNDQDHFRFDLL